MNSDLVFYYISEKTRLEALRCSSTGQAIAHYSVQRNDLSEPYRELKPHLFDPYPDICTVVTLEARKHDFPCHYTFVTLHQLLHPLIVGGKLNRLTTIQIGTYLKVGIPGESFGMTSWIANCYFAYLKDFKRNYAIGEVANGIIDESVAWCKGLLKGV